LNICRFIKLSNISNYDIKEFSKVGILFGIFLLCKNHLQLFLVLAVGSDFLTAIKTPLRCTPLRPSVLWVASKPTGK